MDAAENVFEEQIRRPVCQSHCLYVYLCLSVYLSVSVPVCLGMEILSPPITIVFLAGVWRLSCSPLLRAVHQFLRYPQRTRKKQHRIPAHLDLTTSRHSERRRKKHNHIPIYLSLTTNTQSRRHGKNDNNIPTYLDLTTNGYIRSVVGRNNHILTQL